MELGTVTLDPIDALVVADRSEMPTAARQAFSKLESALPSLKGRKFYGYWDPDAKAYFACVARNEGEDAGAMGLEQGTIPGGRYRRARLKGEPPGVYEQIGRTFEQMSSAISDLDRGRPWLEFYRARDEIDLLVPVA